MLALASRPDKVDVEGGSETPCDASRKEGRAGVDHSSAGSIGSLASCRGSASGVAASDSVELLSP